MILQKVRMYMLEWILLFVSTGLKHIKRYDKINTILLSGADTKPHARQLSHCGLTTTSGDMKWVNIGSANGLQVGSKQLPEIMLI